MRHGHPSAVAAKVTTPRSIWVTSWTLRLPGPVLMSNRPLTPQGDLAEVLPLSKQTLCENVLLSTGDSGSGIRLGGFQDTDIGLVAQRPS
jgi:hypothetical protein